MIAEVNAAVQQHTLDKFQHHLDIYYVSKAAHSRQSSMCFFTFAKLFAVTDQAH